MDPSESLPKADGRAKVLDSKLNCAWTMSRTGSVVHVTNAVCERDCMALSKNGAPNLLLIHIVPLEMTINWGLVIIFRYQILKWLPFFPRHQHTHRSQPPILLFTILRSMGYNSKILGYSEALFLWLFGPQFSILNWGFTPVFEHDFPSFFEPKNFPSFFRGL